MLVHHTDAEHEFSYDRDGHIGVLHRGLDEASGRGVLVDMARDWRHIWSGEQAFGTSLGGGDDLTFDIRLVNFFDSRGSLLSLNIFSDLSFILIFREILA